MTEHNNVTRMNGQVKVRWTEDGKQFGFITDEDTYQRMLHKEYATYTYVLVVREHDVEPGRFDGLPHPTEWHDYGVDANRTNDALWSEDWYERPCGQDD